MNQSKMQATEIQHVTKTPGVCGGKACITGHRIRVIDIVVWHEMRGISPEEIVGQFPGITLADVHAALAYYFENRERVDADIQEAESFVAQMKAEAPLSLVRQKLRQRKIDATDDPLPPG